VSDIEFPEFRGEYVEMLEWRFARGVVINEHGATPAVVVVLLDGSDEPFPAWIMPLETAQQLADDLLTIVNE
jgi:hypothetical protein